MCCETLMSSLYCNYGNSKCGAISTALYESDEEDCFGNSIVRLDKSVLAVADVKEEENGMLN
jgi:hypothetical protein